MRSVQRKKSAVGVEVGPEGQEISLLEKCRARTFAWFRDYDFQRRQGMQETQTEEEVVTCMSENPDKRQNGHK